MDDAHQLSKTEWLRPLRTVGVFLIVLHLFSSVAMSADSQKKYALIVEIKNYEFLPPRIGDPGVPSLRRILQREGFEVLFLNNGTRRNVLRAINELTYQVNETDLLMVALSAGVVTTERNENVYLTFQDTRIDDIEYDGMTLNRLGELLNEIRSKNQLVALVLDTQGTKVRQSSSSSKRSSLQSTRAGLGSIVSDQLIAWGSDRVVLSEVDARDVKTGNTNSLFQLLEEGLSGKADSNNDSVVEIEELQAYVEDKTSLVRLALDKPDVATSIDESGEETNTVAAGVSSAGSNASAESGKVIQTTPITKTPAITRSIKLAKRSEDSVVLTAEAEVQHRIVLAGWVVEGLIDRRDNFRLYTLMSNMRGTSKSQIPTECYNYYKSIEPTLQDAFLVQEKKSKSLSQSQIQVFNLSVAELVKQKMHSFPESCIGKS